MKFYKIIDNGEVTGFSATEFDKSDCSDYIEIDESEYNDAIEQLRVKAEEENLSSDEISAEEFMSLVEELL